MMSTIAETAVELEQVLMMIEAEYCEKGLDMTEDTSEIVAA